MRTEKRSEAKVSSRISPKEFEVAENASRGMNDREIAEAMGISPRTVETYWERIKIKTGSLNRSSSVLAVLDRHTGDEVQQAVLSMEAIHDTLDLVPEVALLNLNRKGRIPNWNTGAQKLLGLTADYAIGNSCSILFSPADVALKIPSKELFQASKMGHSASDGIFNRPDGTAIYLERMVVAHSDRNGEIRGFSIFLKDETKRRNLEAEISLLRGTSSKP